MKLDKQNLQRRLVIVWFVMVALFAGFAFINGGNIVHGDEFYWNSAWHDAIEFGALGAAVATMITVGSFAITGVRLHGLGKGRAISLIGISAAVSAILPPIATACTGIFGSGDDALTIPFVAFFTICTGIFGFVVLTLCVLLVQKKSPPSQD
jgi:hypothetical protein